MKIVQTPDGGFTFEDTKAPTRLVNGTPVTRAQITQPDGTIVEVDIAEVRFELGGRKS